MQRLDESHSNVAIYILLQLVWQSLQAISLAYLQLIGTWRAPVYLRLPSIPYMDLPYCLVHQLICQLGRLP